MGSRGKRYTSQVKLRKGSYTCQCFTENCGSWRGNGAGAAKDELMN